MLCGRNLLSNHIDEACKIAKKSRADNAQQGSNIHFQLSFREVNTKLLDSFCQSGIDIAFSWFEKSENLTDFGPQKNDTVGTLNKGIFSYLTQNLENGK